MPRYAVLLAIALSATACGNGGDGATTSGGAASTATAPAASAQAPATTEEAPATTAEAPASTAAAPATTEAPTGTAAAPITTTGDTPVPDEQKNIVLAWSAAINRNDNAAAAELFAKDAIVAQSAVFKLVDRATAVLWNDGLPCAGRVVELRMVQNAVVATFVLGERPKHQCDAPGHRAGAAFVIEHGKITLWEQVPVPEADPGTPTATTPTASGPVA